MKRFSALFLCASIVFSAVGCVVHERPEYAHRYPERYPHHRDHHEEHHEEHHEVIVVHHE